MLDTSAHTEPSGDTFNSIIILPRIAANITRTAKNSYYLKSHRALPVRILFFLSTYSLEISFTCVGFC